MDQQKDIIQERIDHPESILDQYTIGSHLTIKDIVKSVMDKNDPENYPLTHEQKLQQLENLVARQDICENVSPESFNRQIKEANPDYEPPKNVSERYVAMSNARMNYVKGFLMFDKQPLYTVPPKFNTRSIPILMNQENTEEAKAENDRIVHIINDGTLEEKHDLFLSVLDRLAQVDVEELSNMNDSQVASCYAEKMPVFLLAAERENLERDFKLIGLNLTPEEKQAFKDIATPVYDQYSKFNGDIVRITNPYYPEVDSLQIPSEFTLQSDNESNVKGFAQGYTETYSVNQSYNVKAFDSLNKFADSAFPGKNFNNFYYSDTPDFDPSKTDEYGEYFDTKFAQDMRMGKPVYLIPKEDLENKNLSNIQAVQDFHGKADLTPLPKVQPKPNGLQRFFHNVSKFFGGKGLEVCNRYDQYLVETARFQEAQKDTPPPVSYPQRSAQIENAKKMIYPGMDAQDRERYAEAENRTKEIEKMQDTLSPNEKELNRQRIEARQELTKMSKGKSIDPEAAKKCMATILATTASINSSLNKAYLNKFTETIQSSEVFKNATADLSKKTLLNFLGGDQQSKMIKELNPSAAKTQEVPGVSKVRTAQNEAVQQRKTQEIPNLVG